MGLVEKRLDRLRKEHGKGTAEFHELSRLGEHLEGSHPLRTMRWSEAEEKEMAHFHFLSRQPMLVAINVPEEAAGAPASADVEEAARQRGAEAIALSAEVEAEIAQLDPKDQRDFLDSLGIAEPARARARIHSDLERGFIRAEVMHYNDFLAAGSESKARHEGKLRLEGKEYVVSDGDIINFRFAV